MTAHVAIDEFMTLAAAVPMPTARLHVPHEATKAVEDEWNSARKTFERHLLAWRSSFLRHLAIMRSTLEQVAEEEGSEIAGKIAVDRLPAVREVVAEAAAWARARADRDPDIKTMIGLAKSLPPTARRITQKMLKEYHAGMLRQAELFAEFGDRMLALELDFDPEARGSSAGFDNADDLIAHLRS
jgi:hypothetical protein